MAFDRRRSRYWLGQSLRVLASLTNVLFLPYLDKEYTSRDVFYAKEWARCNRCYFSCMLKLKNKSRHKTNDILVRQQNSIERCYDVLQSMSLLLQRVYDHSTFEVAAKDFLALSARIEKTLLAYAKKISRPKAEIEMEGVEASLAEFEEVNRTALQIVAQDPAVFLLFIEDIRLLNLFLSQLGNDIHAASDA